MKRDRNTPTQEQRVARALRYAGSRGLSQLDFDAPALDGLAPIRRVASRINDLRSKGWVIDSRGRRLGMARYVLVSEPDAPGQHGGGLESADHTPLAAAAESEDPAAANGLGSSSARSPLESNDSNGGLLEIPSQAKPSNAVFGWDGDQ